MLVILKSIDGDTGKLFSVHEGSQERPLKGHRRSSSYGSTGDTSAMMGGPAMPHMGSLRHGQSFSEIPLVYDYQVKTVLSN